MLNGLPANLADLLNAPENDAPRGTTLPEPDSSRNIRRIYAAE
jgi:hypothetical protein